MKELWNTHTMEYNAAMREGKVCDFSAACIDQDCDLLNKIINMENKIINEITHL